MPYTLRPYQAASVEAGLTSLRGAAGAGLLVEPPGSGKSLIVANIVRQLDAPSLVFQPTKEILEQNASKLLTYGYEPAIYSASMGEKKVGTITLATIGSARKEIDLFRDVRYVLIDEADLVDSKAGMYQEFLAGLQNIRILGLTATPFRLVTDGYGGAILKFLTRTRPRVFTDVVHYTQFGDLFRQGFLTPLVYHRVRGFNRQRVSLNRTGADFTNESVIRHFDEIAFRDRTATVVDRLIQRGRKHILVFTRFIEDSEDLVARFPGSAIVTGDTPAGKRAAILDDFKTGRIRVVANCGVLVAGYDYPALDTVVLARPSLSLRLFIQMCGRAVRPSPGKTEAWIIDMVGLTDQFGHLEDMELRAGGKRGQSWEFASGGRSLTNVYFGNRSSDRFKNRWSQKKKKGVSA